MGILAIVGLVYFVSGPLINIFRALIGRVVF